MIIKENQLIENDYNDDIVSWDELNDTQKQYVVDNIYKWRELDYILDWFNEDIMDNYHYDVDELANEYSENYGLDINTDKIYWQSNSQGPYPEWNLEQVFDRVYFSLPNASEGPEITINFGGRSTDVDYYLELYYWDSEYNDWTNEYAIDIDDLSNPVYNLTSEFIAGVQNIINGAQEFIDKVWNLINDVCTAYPDSDYIYDVLSNHEAYFEIISDTEAEPV